MSALLSYGRKTLFDGLALMASSVSMYFSASTSFEAPPSWMPWKYAMVASLRALAT